jgi:hypothetical protein
MVGRVLVMGKVALVSLGGAGTSVMREVTKANLDIDMYNVNSKRSLKNVKYYGFEEIELLADELKNYDTVVLTAGLGSTGGDALVKLYHLLDTVRRVCFLISPFYFEIDRLIRSRGQISRIVSDEFEGAIISLNTILREGVEGGIVSKTQLERAISKFDKEMAEMIVDFIPEFQ